MIGRFEKSVFFRKVFIMVDIHTHILPHLDDGSETFEESVRMAELSAACGVNHLAASSHGNYYDYTLEEYKAAFRKLRAILIDQNIPVRLYPAMEIFLDNAAFSMIENYELLSINHTDYLLVEFPFEENTGNVCHRIASLQESGYRVVLAHPERYIFMQKEPELAYYLNDQHCVLQTNAGSLLGDFGETCRRLALQLLNDGIIRVIASDAHDTDYRSTDLSRALRFLRANYSTGEIRLWLSENPSRILKGYPTIGFHIEKEEEC